MATIQGVYLALFGRPADPLGLSFFNTATGNGADLTAIGDLTATAEYQARFAGQSTTQIITSIYQSLFNREPDLAGLTYFANALANKTLTVNNIAIAIYDGAQGADKTVLALKEAAANAFTAAIDTVAEINGYTGSTALSAASAFLAGVTTTAPDAAAVTAAVAAATTGSGTGSGGKTTLLTTDPNLVDGTAGNETVDGLIDTTLNSTASTFTAVDVIDGKGGTDTINLTVVGSGNGALPVATVNNIEKYNIRTLSTGTNSYDFSLVNGETEVWADRSTQAVTFTKLAEGTTIGIKGDNTTTLGSVTAGYVDAASKTAKLAFEGGIKGTPDITITSSATETVTITSTGAANTIDELSLSSGSSLKALTIDAATNFTAVLVNANFDTAGADLVVKGAAASVNLGSNGIFKTIDATGMTAGGVTATTNSVTTTIKGGAGNDVITVADSTKITSIALGAGNDSLVGSVPTSATATVDGGDGVDTILSDLVNIGNGGKITGFEVLDLGANDLDVNLLTGSTLTKLLISSLGGGGGTFNQIAAGLGLEVTATNGGGATINVKDATSNTSDTFTVTFAAAAQATAPAQWNVSSGQIGLNKIEAVTVVSGGGANTWNALTLADDKMKTLTINGDKNIDIVFSGTVGVNPGSDGGAVSLIDGSAATGKLKLDVDGVAADNKVGLTIKGGSAADTIKLYANLQANDVKATVIAGAGDDTIIFSSVGGTATGGDGKDVFDVSRAVGASPLVTITDFVAGTDKLTLKNGTGTEVFTATKLDIGLGQNLADALDLAASSTTANTGPAIKWFHFATDTYIVEDLSAAATLASTDIVVKLTGTVDLSALTVAGFNFAA